MAKNKKINQLIKYRNELIECSNYKKICEKDNHIFKGWYVHTDSGKFEDLWYYTRKCERCGKTELKYNIPNEINPIELILKMNRKKFK